MDNPIILIGGAISAILAALILLSNRKRIFWAVFVMIFFPIVYFDRYFFEVPSIVLWTPFIVSVGMAILSFIFLKRELYLPRILLLGYAVILGIDFLSILANRSPMLPFLVSQRSYVTFFCIIVIFSLIRDIYDKEDILGFTIWTGIASATMSLIQRLVFVPLSSSPYAGDMVTGLFSVDFITLFFHLFCISIILTYWFYDRPLISIPNSYALFIMVFSIAVGNNKAGIAFLILVIAFVIFRVGIRTVFKNFGKSLIGFVVIPIIFFAIFTTIYDKNYDDSKGTTSSEMLTDQSTLEKLMFGTKTNRLTPSGELVRGYGIIFAFDNIKDDFISLMLGLGPGAVSESNFPGAEGFLAERYPDYHISKTPMAMYLGETGVLGVISNILFLILISFWRPPGQQAEPRAHMIIRQTFTILSIAYFFYDNMYYEPPYGLMIAVLVYPTLATEQSNMLPSEEPAEREMEKI